MKTIISAFLFLGILSVNAQQNIFLHNDFWDEETTIKQVKEAIKNGNDPVAFSEFNFDATAYAILNNSPLETVLFLLDIEGNEVTKITHDARNYLMWAAHRGNYELTKVLMEKGSDIHIVDDKGRSEEHTSELQSRPHLVCRLLLEKKNKKIIITLIINQLQIY